MNDCMNAEIRDQLPDLVHDRLSAADRASVLAHVESCGDCRDELQLLRDAKVLFARGIPRVDVAYVVGGLPKAPAPRGVTRLESRRRPRVWNDWRVAAAVTLLIAGGGSYAMMSSGTTTDMFDTVIAANAPALTASQSIALTEDSSPTSVPDIAALVSAEDEIPEAIGSMDARLVDLNEDQLNMLLNEMDDLRAIPAGEPAAASLRIDGPGTGTTEDM